LRNTSTAPRRIRAADQTISGDAEVPVDARCPLAAEAGTWAGGTLDPADGAVGGSG